MWAAPIGARREVLLRRERSATVGQGSGERVGGPQQEVSQMAFSPRRDLHDASGGWWVLSLVGLLSIAAGVIILFKPGDSLKTLAVIAGIFLVVDAIMELTAAIMGVTQSRGLLALLGV